MAKIDIATLRKIILEEVKSLREGDREDSAASLSMAASKLLKSVEVFKDSASDMLKADLEHHLVEVEKILKRVIDSPTRYVDAPKKMVKKVSLKPTDIM